MFDDEDDDEENEETFLSSFFNEDEIRVIIEREREKSMNFTFDVLEDLGIENWYKTVPFGVALLKILNNMLNYFLELEEFEKCALIRDAIIYGKTFKNEKI